MKPRIAVSCKWSDDDILQLECLVCDGRSSFVCEVYTARGWGAATAKGLKAFAQQVHGGIYNLEAGAEGPEYASGAFRARFHYHKPTDLLISTSQQGEHFEFKQGQVASEATMFLRTEPALLDRFVAALPSVDNSGAEIELECQSVFWRADA